jgi:hypothetical protein
MLRSCNNYGAFTYYYYNHLTLTQMKLDVIKANRKGSREAELENKTGWQSKHSIVASVKTYKRNPKHKLQP